MTTHRPDPAESHRPPLEIDPAVVAATVATSGRVLIVLDDDPTGTQSVSDLPVLTRWERDDFAWALAQSSPAVYVLTNTRSLDPETAAARNREIVLNALAAAELTGTTLGFVSRSDSTLRGHFPLETDVIADTLLDATGTSIDAVVIVPAFPDAGRVTVDGVHFTRVDGELVPVAETEFARDATFGYASSYLPAWVEEKTQGRIPAADVVVCDLTTLRSGPEAVAALLATARNGQPIVVDAVVEDDLRALALGLDLAELRGTNLLYRVGPPFVRARIGQEQRAPLTAHEVYGGTGPQTGGLIVVGSHVGLTTRQLAALRRDHPGATTFEIDVATLTDPAAAAGHVEEIAAAVGRALDDSDVIVHTSRLLVRTDDPDESLAISRSVSAGVVAVVNTVLHRHPLRYVIAKGGITSSDVAAYGLEISRATVRGPMLPGLVSLWQPSAGPAVGIPYVVFAGNVGDDDSLSAVVSTLTAFPATPPTAVPNAAAPTAEEPAMTPTATTSTHATTIAVIGLGAMGLPMATCLNEEFTVHGVDIAPARLSLAAEAGITTFDTAVAAVADVDAVLLVVRNGAQLDDVLFGERGIASSLRRGATVILGSTVGIDAVTAVTPRLDELGIDLVDAPLSGGPVRAGAGDLLIVVGARPAALAKVRAVVDRLASTVSVVGDEPGAGQALKTVNQLLCGVHIAAAAEALALADALGLDPATTLEALQAGAANSFMLGNRGPRMLQAYDEDGAEVLSRLDIFVKDMGIVGKAARAAGLPAPVAAAAEQLYLLGQAHGLAADDDSAVIKAIAPIRPQRG